MSDTIAAVATPLSAGGIGVIRISGDCALEIADRVICTSSGKKLSSMKGYTAAHGKVYFENEAVDECVALVFRAPKSYTGEDTVEISCHGGVLVTKQVLRAVLQNGARPATAGEFTKRAFLNGKMDLSEAEAVMSLIGAQGQQGMKAAYNALDGALSRRINELCQILLSACANIAAWVDYPDDEIPELDNNNLKNDLIAVEAGLDSLLSKFDAGKAITDGVETAIVGKPNVGKSALMNMLSGFNRSIVTDIAGTTRDIVEQTVRVGNVVLRLADTAGIRESEDIVESIGVDMAKTKIERATLILAVFDGSGSLEESDKQILDLCRGRDVIGIINKTDLPSKTDIQYLQSILSKTVFISAKTNEGEDELTKAIEESLGTDKIDTSQAMLTTERQRSCAQKAIAAVKEAHSALEIGMTMDAVNVCLEDAIEALLELTGKKAREAVVDEVFAQFCVGK
ncbi:MAG: tRNA uridine-5-carboxymethylaminomethyl(34) synthesis GTPase MnmE [Acutalibacteraceae bacterium]|nr:tRNA uridine-5-carboxymethylaminomethyl(34) synthesis GTPase MnmE [Acutalibacteraceae bacterium]